MRSAKEAHKLQSVRIQRVQRLAAGTEQTLRLWRMSAVDSSMVPATQ